MIGALIGIIITLIIVGVLWWAVEQLLPLIPLPAPFAQIMQVLMVVILFLWLCSSSSHCLVGWLHA